MCDTYIHVGDRMRRTVAACEDPSANSSIAVSWDCVLTIRCRLVANHAAQGWKSRIFAGNKISRH